MRIWGLVFLAACIPTVIVLHPLMSVLELILGVLLLALSFYTGKPQPSPRWVKRMWKKYQEGGQLYNCCFAEDGCWIHDSKGDHRYDYAALTILWEDPEHFYLVTPGNSVYILRKDSFSHGRPENLPAFWEAQTGKPVQQVQ